jgi:hypothetical protein
MIPIVIPAGGISFPASPSAGDLPLFTALGVFGASTTSYANVGYAVTIRKAGVYRFSCAYYSQSQGNAVYIRLTQNGTAISGSEQSTTSILGAVYTYDVTCAVDDVIRFQRKHASGCCRVLAFSVSILAADVQAEIDKLITVAAV